MSELAWFLHLPKSQRARVEKAIKVLTQAGCPVEEAIAIVFGFRSAKTESYPRTANFK